ncbi:DUF1186 domain-containing protein [Bythopirellula polymerisocia]|uniref:Preprotein translocase subunit SecA n=1 Tax=Bythopirellula polymerisocia TaxID=2528003 RepID=A0A5C6CD87_9BACT|nr:DUF1186 domain-containing protein [Bythopirellula polymerisocia]TWU20779.1 hypothetical protein Pla144_48300 [Bythopirellula polymerisocia]
MTLRVEDSSQAIDRVIQQLDAGTKGLPEEAILQARMNRDAIIPRLIEAIQTAAERAESGNLPEGNAHFFALFLLTEFHAKEALPAIIGALSLPGELPFDLFGDAVTESLPRVLADLASDDPEAIADLIRNQAVNEYVRGAAACTYLHFVRDGRLTRDEAIDRLRRYLREAIDNKDVEIIYGLVDALADYSPQEVFDDIENAFELGLVDDEIVDLEDVRRSISEGESGFLKALSYCGPTGIHDTVEELKGWSAFSDEVASESETEIFEDEWLREPPLIAQEPEHTTFHNDGNRIGRNAPCPCGSGRKYKKCCGRR